MAAEELQQQGQALLLLVHLELDLLSAPPPDAPQTWRAVGPTPEAAAAMLAELTAG